MGTGETIETKAEAVNSETTDWEARKAKVDKLRAACAARPRRQGFQAMVEVYKSFGGGW